VTSSGRPPGRWALSRTVANLAPSATIAINERSRELIRAGQKVYRFGLGQSPFPVPRSVVEELRVNAHQKDYLPMRGLERLRGAVVDYYRRRHGLSFHPDGVLVGPGSKELMFLLQVVFDGELVIPSPGWVSYAPQAQILGRDVVFLPTRFEDGWKLHPTQLDELCAAKPERARVLVLNYPSNPTGATYDAAELESIAAAARRNNLIVLSDEIYGELEFDGNHATIASFYSEGTIISSGLSKWCGAGGWRLGTFAFPESLFWLADAMAAVASETYTSVSAPIQFAAVSAFQSNLGIERYLANTRRLLGPLLAEVRERLSAAGARVTPAQGGFYLFPDLTPLSDSLARRGVVDGPSLCARLLEERHVAVLPGSDFGRAREELTLRIACVDFDGARALAALETLPPAEKVDSSLLAQLCEPVLEGVDRLADWLAS
jgi:aspartate aminotransferase